MKNRILAALLALVLGVPLYLLAADAVPTAAGQNRFLRRPGPGRGPAEGPSLRGGPGRPL